MEFWNPYTETLPGKLQKIEFSYFKNLLAYAKVNSRLYKDKLKGISIEDIKTFDDIEKNPFHFTKRN